MKEALIVLSLLGCDDTGAQCHYLQAAEHHYQTLEQCRAASPDYIEKVGAGADYPTVVATCSPEYGLAANPEPPEEPREDLAEVQSRDMTDEGFLKRIGSAVASVLPERETVEKPIVLAADGALKVGNAVIVGISRAANTVNPFATAQPEQPAKSGQ